MIQSVRHVVQVQCLHDNISLSCEVFPEDSMARKYLEKNLWGQIVEAKHIGNALHFNATRAELIERLIANPNLNVASTIIPDDLKEFCKYICSVIPENTYKLLDVWKDGKSYKPFKIIVPFSEDVADYLSINRNGEDLDVDSIVLVFDKAYDCTVPFKLHTIYPTMKKDYLKVRKNEK